jgi:hypothetical protein
MRRTQRSVAFLVAGVAALDPHERDAVEAFLRNPNGENAETVATYASVESEAVEQAFRALPDTLAWKDEGKWHLAAVQVASALSLL